MFGNVRAIFRRICKFTPIALVVAFLIMPHTAHASWGIIDSFNLAPFIPMILDALMSIATGGYEFFVGNGDGIIYVLVWGFLAVSLSLYLVKLYLPKVWVSFFGFSGGGEMSGGITGMQISMNILKPAIRAVIAATFLLQVKPTFVTNWLVNPFLEFGSIYTSSIINTINQTGTPSINIECPQDILDNGWISQSSCEFLVKPVAEISNANNHVIKRGLEFVERGLVNLMALLIPHGMSGFLDLITGILLVSTFVACNLFMALLIIQAIFEFGMQLTLYPFNVLMWVAKPKNPDKWFDILPPFSGIIKSLQNLVITMIACAFILCVNIAVIQALFHWNSSIFVVAADGAASSNVPNVANAMGFGQHSLLWLSTILTFYLMLRIFELTRQQLRSYTKDVPDDMYKQVMSDTKTVWNKGTDLYHKAGEVPGIAKNIGKGAAATWHGAKWTGQKIGAGAKWTGQKTWTGMKWVGRKLGF